eukprot:m.449973 g.449973  ORF g.449973 m.449973 type:complete len:245 (+) comp19895_c0_seq1:152-886(+)
MAEFVSPEGLRLDGRRPNDLRRIVCRLGQIQNADGSAYLEHGNTKVLAIVYGPHEVSAGGTTHHDRASIRTEYSTATFSTLERKYRSKGDKKSTEVEVLLAQTFAEAVITNLYPRSEVNIFVQVLQSDGGEVVAAINAATLAVIDAGIAMRDYVVACSVGCIDGVNVLDVNRIEGGAHGPELTVAILPKTERIVTTTMESRIHTDQFKALLDLALVGCASTYTSLRDAVVLRTEALAATSINVK